MGRQLRRQTIALLLTVLLVASAVPISPVGSAAATHEYDCGKIDKAIFSFGAPLVVLSPTQEYEDAANFKKCGETHSSELLQNMSENDADQVRSDLHAAANDEKADREVFFAQHDNYLNDTETAAWSWLEVELAEDFQNGTTEAGATSRAKGSLQDYYSVKAVNLIEQWNTTIVSAKTMENTSDMEENVSDDFHNVSWDSGTCSGGCTGSASDASIKSFSTTEVTLPNGTTHTARTVVVEGQASGYSQEWEIGPSTGEVDTLFDDVASSIGIQGLMVGAPTSDHDPVQYLTFEDYATRYQEIDDQSSSLTGEADQFVNTTYDAWVTGQINASDVISQNTAMTRLAADQVSGNNTMYRSTAALSMMGLDVPEINGTGTMEVTYGTDTYTGMLLAESAPNGTWEANTSYNTENVTGTTYLVTTNGEMKTLSGDFTTGTFTNETGHAIQSVNHTRPVYKTADTDDVLAKILAQQAYRQEVENREPLLGGGGGMGDGSGLDPMTAAGIGAALVALLVIVTRG